MKSNGWKHKPKTKLVVGTETNPTKLESGQVVINKKATKQNLDRLIEINNDGLDKPIKKEVTTDGTEGGLLKGKPHYDKNGNSLGGIPAVVDGAKNIETEGEEFLLNKEASQKHWKELSKINQSAGNGVPINPSDVGADEDPEEFRQGGTAKIEFNPNHIPNKWIYSYAKKVKEKYPKVWDMGGNIFGNEAFNNLERVLKRGYWTDNEEWMYIKWRSYVARHHKDFRIAGTVAMLKWVDKTDKGWDYMKDLIDKEIAKKYPKKGFKTKMGKGGELIKRADGSYSRRGLWDNIRANIGSGKKPTKEMLEQEAKIRSKMEYGGSVEIIINEKDKEIRGDKDYYPFDIVSNGKKLGFIELMYRADLNGYQISNSSVKEKGKGTGKKAYLELIKTIDKPIFSDSSLTDDAKNLWLSLVRGGYAYFDESKGKYVSNEIGRKEYGGGIKDIRCKCGWGWNKNESEKHDEYVCHKCGTDNKMQTGGMMEGQPPANFENVLYRELANRYEYGGFTTTTSDNIKVGGLNHYQKTKKSGKFYRIYGEKHINNDEVESWWIFFTIKDGVKDLGIIRYRFENEKKDIYKEMVISFNDLPNSLKEVYNNITETYKDGGATDDFDWESLFNPSEEEEEKINQEIKKSKEQEKEDWYQGTKFSKKWAATYQDAVNRTVKEYLDAKATYEDWGSRQYKSNKGMVFLGGDDVFGEAKSIGSINEGRRKRVLRGAKMQMDESIELLKELRLTDEEISNLLNNKMGKGGTIESHEDLESRIMKQQFGR
jgi:hypothetical protein